MFCKYTFQLDFYLKLQSYVLKDIPERKRKMGHYNNFRKIQK